jgi:hypothetical protein
MATVEPNIVLKVSGPSKNFWLTPRDLLLFTMEINNGLRTGNLLRLTVKEVSGFRPGEHIHMREQKTGKDKPGDQQSHP